MGASDGTSPAASYDGEGLWKLAKRIEEKQVWAGYLSEQEHAIWREALRKRNTWEEFLKGRGESIDPAQGHDGGENANATSKAEDNSEKVTDPVTAAFRARVMLFEASVRKLFPTRASDEFLDFDIDDTLDNSESRELVIEEKPKTREIEEDDYDDDEEQGPMALVHASELSSQNDENSMNNLGLATFNSTLTI